MITLSLILAGLSFFVNLKGFVCFLTFVGLLQQHMATSPLTDSFHTQKNENNPSTDGTNIL